MRIVRTPARNKVWTDAMEQMQLVTETQAAVSAESGCSRALQVRPVVETGWENTVIIRPALQRRLQPQLQRWT